MRLLTFRTDGTTRAARVEGASAIELPYDDVAAVLASGELAAIAELDGPAHALADLDLAPVVPRPGKVICVGLNYATHIKEMGRELPSHPTIFAKYTQALIGAADPIRLPPESDSADWEVELAFVIGTRGRRIAEADAARHIGGYTVLNDVSMRDWQNRTMQFLQGKTFEASTPVGPVLVTPDEVDAHDLTVRCSVDGQVMQEASTADLLFKPEALVAYLSTIMTLEPGDLVATGTPAGVAAGRPDRPFLKPGQVVVTEIEGIGTMTNRCELDVD